MMHTIVFLLISHILVCPSATTTAIENLPNMESVTIGPAGNTFISVFSQAMRSSSVSTELFDLGQNSGDELAAYIYRDALEKLSSWGVDDADYAAQFATQHISQHFPDVSVDNMINAFGHVMANYLASEGILNEGNAQTLALAYAKSFEDSAKSNMNSEPGSKFEAIGNGFVPFVTSMVQMTPEKGSKLARFVGDAWRLEADQRLA